MTVINSWGGPNSNAYIDVSQANSYIESAIFDPSAWTSATTAQKNAALMQATIDIDSRQYVGNRFFYDQHLEFPRETNPRFPQLRSTTAVGSLDVVQARMLRNVHEATAHQALHIARNGGRNKHLENIANGIRGISESMGPMREFVQYGQRVSQSVAKFDTVALSLLQPWLTGRRIARK